MRHGSTRSSIYSLQREVQLTDTPIFAIFGEVSVDSQMSVNLRILKMSFFWPKKRLFLVCRVVACYKIVNFKQEQIINIKKSHKYGTKSKKSRQFIQN